MEEVLNHPAVQAGVAPFIAGLVVAGVLGPLRAGGLATAAGFLTAVFLVSGFQFSPLTATRKLILLGMLAPAIGLVADFAFKPTRATGPVLGAMFGAASVWTFISVLQQKPMNEAVLMGGGIALLTAWLVAATYSLRDEPVRLGASGVILGVGVGVAAVLSASASFGQFGIALGAGAGGYLLIQMVLGRVLAGGATFALAAGVTGALLAGASFLLAQLPWMALPLLALIPLAAHAPLPGKAPVWGQAILASIYAVIPAAGAWFLIWQSSRGSA
ncbi:MAG: hypothetical protein HY017_10410 [Betaproteobacteria bacterium]|nr:hypothetical protein [Betaproteobacteria bacterium]